MADKEVSELTAASALAASDTFHIVQSGNSRKATAAQMKAYHGEGWGLFSDAATALEANAVTIAANTRTLVTIDGGTGSITTHVGNSGIQWSANEHIGAGIGDSWSHRLSFMAKKSGGAAAYILADMDINDGGSTIIAAQEQALRTDTAGHPLTFNFLGYSLSTYAANGARFYITSTAQIQVWAKSVFIRKDFKAPA